MRKILFFVCLCFLMLSVNVCGAAGLTVKANCKVSPASYSYGLVSKVQRGLGVPISATYYGGDGGGIALGVGVDYLEKISSSLLGGIYYGYDYLLTGDNKGESIASYGIKLVIKL